jgi:hypothetical protein
LLLAADADLFRASSRAWQNTTELRQNCGRGRLQVAERARTVLFLLVGPAGARRETEIDD